MQKLRKLNFFDREEVPTRTWPGFGAAFAAQRAAAATADPLASSTWQSAPPSALLGHSVASTSLDQHILCAGGGKRFLYFALANGDLLLVDSDYGVYKHVGLLFGADQTVEVIRIAEQEKDIFYVLLTESRDPKAWLRKNADRSWLRKISLSLHSSTRTPRYSLFHPCICMLSSHGHLPGV